MDILNKKLTHSGGRARSSTFTSSGFTKDELSSGILTGCGQKWGIVRHYKGQLCGKKYQLCSKLCGSQFLISNVLGVLNGVLIGILVYLSDGINIST